MATLDWEVYCGTPSWTAVGAYTLCFSGSSTNIFTTIAAGAFNYGTHLGSGTPGTDECGTTHCNNAMIASSSTVSINGATAVALSDTGIADTSCSFRLHFNDSNSYSVQNGRIYSFDGITTTNPSVGVDAALWVKNQSATSWTTLNSSTTTGPAMAGMSFQTANLGGDNTGSQYALNSQTGATDYYYPALISVSPETPGDKTSFSLGAYIEYY